MRQARSRAFVDMDENELMLVGDDQGVDGLGNDYLIR
jgi:hypothetical protein